MQENNATFLALGSNLPASHASSVDLLESAINAIAAARVRVIAASLFFRSVLLGASEPDFV